MTRPQYDETWHDAQRTRATVAGWVRSAPELFPPGFDRGYRLHGFGRPSRKLPGIKLRRLVTADGVSYWLRPSFAAGYMTGTVEEPAFPLLLAAHGVPAWLLTIGFGRGEMYWYRVVERLGRSSLVGATVRDPARLPEHLAADEHHADWAGRKGYVAIRARPSRDCGAGRCCRTSGPTRRGGRGLGPSRARPIGSTVSVTMSIGSTT